MGIHTGSADERGGDYFGQTPTRAARIMAAAWGGQVLMSGVTSELIGRDRTIDLGVHRLRDLVDSVEIRQLVVDDLPRDFAPPRTASATVNNLPDQRTSFIGREELVGDIRDVFESSRLVTLVGVGGVGKTRLAVQTAAELLPRFADGVWLCELATASADAAVADVIVSSLGIPHQSDRSVAASIVAFLRNRETLVVLDNCEHVVDAAADLIESLLAGCPKTSVLVTSREALAVRGERIVAVPPLTVPDSGSSQSASSVELFMERAVGRGVDPRDLTAASESIAEICRRLDGLPLAIELAAARTTSMSPADILANLDHRFSLLTGGGTRRRDRRRTLEKTIEWSYALLDARERAVFARLGVIAASFDLETACAVGETAEIARGEVLDIVDSLVSQSLLVAESGPGGESRYRYLETIRHYAEGRVEAAGQLNSASKVHARRLGEWMQRCAIQSVGPDEERWLAHLSLEVPNVGRAVDWAITEEPALVAAMLSPFASRVISVIDSVVPIAAHAVKDWRSPQPPHYGVLVLAAEHSVATTEYAEAKRLAELAIERSNPDDFGAAQAHNGVATRQSSNCGHRSRLRTRLPAHQSRNRMGTTVQRQRVTHSQPDGLDLQRTASRSRPEPCRRGRDASARDPESVPEPGLSGGVHSRGHVAGRRTTRGGAGPVRGMSGCRWTRVLHGQYGFPL